MAKKKARKKAPEPLASKVARLIVRGASGPQVDQQLESLTRQLQAEGGSGAAAHFARGLRVLIAWERIGLGQAIERATRPRPLR